MLLGMYLTYIRREFASHIDQLCGIDLNLLNAATVRLHGVDGISAQLIDDFEISCESVWMLVVFGGNVGADRVGECDRVGAAEGNLEDVSRLHLGWR